MENYFRLRGFPPSMYKGEKTETLEKVREVMYYYLNGKSLGISRLF
jgi:hypothetical protein